MAAKQGFTAHISQASEDARRAVLSRAPTAITSHSWLSNLNTTCTIKSAPPRTPEVMTLLSNKSGWLVKRNEQQVWQRRWCCVVPHTFLYYFEAEPVTEDYVEDDGTREGFSGGGVYKRSEAIIVENQDQLNAAVEDGCSKIKFKDGYATPLKGRDANATYSPSTSMDKVSMTPTNLRGPTTTSGKLLPAGIIDLECYSCVNRSPRNELVFELKGDEKINPDLRSFYFQAGSVDDCEMWTSALLSDRHSALRDEREAYRQVCDSFQLQLQNLSDMIDEAEAKTNGAEKQLYNVRSAAEKLRGEIVNIVREALEQKCWSSNSSSKTNGQNNEPLSEAETFEEQMEKNRLFYMEQVDEVISSENIGTVKNTSAIVTQLLAEYLATVIGSYTEMGVEVNRMEQKLSRSAGVDKAAVDNLKLKIEKLENEKEEQTVFYKSNVAKLKSQIQELQSTNEELSNQMQTQRVEFSMFQSQAKSKLQELSQHKKILKKEVIDLRKKVDEIGSERDAAMHITDTHKLHAETEKEKNAMLERYIEKMENQVAVQQNMMEMISLSGMSQGGMSQYDGPVESDVGNGEVSNSNHSRSNSVVGRIIAAPDDGSLSSFGPRHYKTLPLRDASPYRLPPKSRVSSSEITNKQRREELPPSSPPKAIKRSAMQAPFTEPKKMPISEKTPRRGTLDHEFLDQNDNAQEESNDNGNDKNKKCISNDQQHEPNKEESGSPSKDHDQSTDNDLADNDEKSHVSDLTEDRTQRGFDTKLHERQDRQGTIQYTVSDMTGENVVNGIPKKKNLMLSHSSSQENDSFPPRYIMGVPQNEMDDEQNDNVSTSNKEVDSSPEGTKLSVAQRARLAAEKSSGNSVNISSEAETVRLKEAKEREQRLVTPPKTRSQSPGMFSNLASMIGRRRDTKPQQDNNGEVVLTLAERQEQQRLRQLRVLREQGLLKDGEDSITGGPGAQSIRSGSSPRSRQ